jgi:polyhydroxyalkanoate synthase
MLDVKDSVRRTARWLSLASGQVRVPIATTPREAVFQRDKMTLYRYPGAQPARYAPPVLLVYSLINRPSVLDLRPGRSVVQHLLGRGFEVYLLDWGIPDPLDRECGLDLHIDLLLRTAVRQVCRHSGRPGATLLGYCMGGTLAAIYAALHPGRVANLVLLGAPFRFRSGERLYRWSRDPHFRPRQMVEALGNVPTWVFEGFSLLRPGQKMERLAALYDRLDQAAWVESHLAMEQWVNDNVPMAGALFADFVEACFQEDRLIEGRLEVGGRPVRLERIACPTLVMAGAADHLVPPETALPAAEKIPGAETLLFPCGHIGLSTSSKAHLELWPAACDWLARHSQPLEDL